MSYFTAKALSAEEEDKLDSEQKQAYVNEKAEEVERLQRIADEATDAARRGRVSRQRRESLPVSESAEWALKISRSVFAGSSTDRERLNRRMDQEDMCTARDMFEQLVNDAWCRKWLGDPQHIIVSYLKKTGCIDCTTCTLTNRCRHDPFTHGAAAVNAHVLST